MNNEDYITIGNVQYKLNPNGGYALYFYNGLWRESGKYSNAYIKDMIITKDDIVLEDDYIQALKAHGDSYFEGLL